MRINIVKKTFFIFLLIGSVQAEIYDLSIPENDTASYNYADFRMWVDDSTDTLRGIYWFMHPNNGDSRNIVHDSSYQILAGNQDFALLGAHIYSMDMQTGIGDAVIAAMDSFSVLSIHDEISFIPFFINGYSWGGQFGYHFTRWIPERVLGFITQKGGHHDSTHAGGAMEVPGLMFVAENDLPYRIENLTGIFLSHRPLGAKWILAMEQGAGHTQVTDYLFLDSFFNNVANLRLPDSMNVFQPVTLNTLSDSMGWLGDQSTWTIGAWDCYDGMVDSSSWFPTREVGELWQNFVSEGSIIDTSACDSTTVETDIKIPEKFLLHPPYPNPFNPITTIRYDLPEQTTVNIIIYDMLGRRVKTVVKTNQEAGFKSVIWDGTNNQGNPVSAGVYFYQIQAGDFVLTKKMVLLK